MAQRKGDFTLPGEAEYEKLTLELAEKWGADVIRDSDGTALSEEILNAGYSIYSTVCIIRDHNKWAMENPDKLQQSFLVTAPKVAIEKTISINIMEDFYAEQFRINESKDAFKYWQVYDRTANQEVDKSCWDYDYSNGTVTITKAIPWHKYTVSFMVYRIWEEISMYNHITNNWNKEHLIQIDPRYQETQDYLLDWMENWCKSHPDTDVVRFTSMFYNFVWIWGSNERNRNLFSDWASYDFTVSTLALNQFAEKYGYSMTAEDFVNQGKFHATHAVANERKMDWMGFINDFIIDFGKKLINIAHKYNKLAYVFYDDSWVGVEPYNGRFQEFGFDGLIKCVFSGYEARLCAGVDVKTHELRLHPYLFPVGLGGAPTFTEGGNPTSEAKKFWINIRRALLREPVDRIGLGGYLHLVEPFPDFCDYIEKISDEFRTIKEVHNNSKPYSINTKVAVLHSWGKLRSWTLSGHFHETNQHDLIHINEALSGLPIEVSFINFEDVKNGILSDFDIDVVINAGYAGSAWSGGNCWNDVEVVDILTKWVYEGGTFMGVNEPSATEGYDTYFRMAHVLGIDKDTGARNCHGRWSFEIEPIDGLIPDMSLVNKNTNLYLTDGKAKVLSAQDGIPDMTVNEFGEGKGIYLAGFRLNLKNTRMLLNLILFAGKEDLDGLYLMNNSSTECAYYPDTQILMILNNSDSRQVTSVKTEKGVKTVELDAYDMKILSIFG